MGELGEVGDAGEVELIAPTRCGPTCFWHASAASSCLRLAMQTPSAAHDSSALGSSLMIDSKIRPASSYLGWVVDLLGW